jgi:lysozyme
MNISEKGLAFIAGHEGFVSTAYRDPVGVLTTGYGFTMRSRVFAAWWRARYGRALRMGDRITKDGAAQVLRALIAEEYGAAVMREFGPLPQHQYDAACSVAYNLGPGALKWRWAQALKAGNVARAAAILRDNHNTAGGRRLPGLVRRRREEAHLLETGEYIGVGKAPRDLGKTDTVDQAHEDIALLKRLGFDTGDFVSDTRNFQTTHAPPLVIDGIFGPATRATAKRALERKTAAKGGTGVVGGAGAAAIVGQEAIGIDWTTIALGLGTAGAVLVLAYLAWANRGRIMDSLPAPVRRWLEGWT